MVNGENPFVEISDNDCTTFAIVILMAHTVLHIPDIVTHLTRGQPGLLLYSRASSPTLAFCVLSLTNIKY